MPNRNRVIAIVCLVTIGVGAIAIWATVGDLHPFGPALMPTPASASWQTTVDAFAALNPPLTVSLLQDESTTLEEHDVNQYFTVLTHLSPEPEYVLDYVICGDFHGLAPVIYARHLTEQPYIDCEEYEAAYGQLPSPWLPRQHQYLEHITIQDTPEAYFEFVVLRVMGGQFYLYWHADYNDSVIVCSHDGVATVLDAVADDDLLTPVSDDMRRVAEAMDVYPRVDIGEDTVHVRVVTFSKWAGFVETVFEVGRQFPHSIVELESNVLVPYDCGMVI